LGITLDGFRASSRVTIPVGTASSLGFLWFEQAEPEQGSDFFKFVAKVKDACSNAAQVKEILRIRTDKVARQRVVETYEALVDCMALADVDNHKHRLNRNREVEAL
jgi:hypothetical protein